MADKIPIAAVGLLLGGYVLTALLSPFGPPVILLGIIGLVNHLVHAFAAQPQGPDARLLDRHQLR